MKEHETVPRPSLRGGEGSTVEGVVVATPIMRLASSRNVNRSRPPAAPEHVRPGVTDGRIDVTCPWTVIVWLPPPRPGPGRSTGGGNEHPDQKDRHTRCPSQHVGDHSTVRMWSGQLPRLPTGRYARPPSTSTCRERTFAVRRHDRPLPLHVDVVGPVGHDLADTALVFRT